MSKRLVAILLRLGGCRMTNPPHKGPIDVHVNQNELAHLSNVARTTAGSVLRSLTLAGSHRARLPTHPHPGPGRAARNVGAGVRTTVSAAVLSAEVGFRWVWLSEPRVLGSQKALYSRPSFRLVLPPSRRSCRLPPAGSPRSRVARHLTLATPVPSEGKGHTFELCRVRHSSP